MRDQFVEATERAIAKLVTDFQHNSDRFWNERDMHWILFYYLKQEGTIQEAYSTQLIRAEFPTVKKFGEKNPARGHYDLVVLDPESYSSEAVQRMKAWDPWDEYLQLVKVVIAVEIKLWLARLPLERTDWDIQKLTETSNNVLNAYFLNFVQLNFGRQHTQDYYRDLREYLMRHKKRWPDLRILCVPSDAKIQPDPSNNWLVLP
ncbi:MAG: hypothetical protein WCA51_02600 [Dehalococcoidia bacterium]